MGRGKIEIKRIENSNNRQVTFSKRRGGIIKKAKEITVLCDAKVSLIIFANSGKMYEFCSPSSTLVEILEQYQKQSGKKLWDAKHENLSNEVERMKKENDNLQIKLRHLKGEDISSLNHRELGDMEAALGNGLECVREQMMEVVMNHRRNVKMLEEENKELNSYYQQQQQRDHHIAMAENVKEVDNAYIQQRLRDLNFNSQQAPFGYRVQPFHPNLQDRM